MVSLKTRLRIEKRIAILLAQKPEIAVNVKKAEINLSLFAIEFSQQQK